jgi:hypothetical protein
MKSFRQQFKNLFLLILPAFVLCGCGEKKPDGLPRLQPASLQFTQDGAPCGGASVVLVPLGESPWIVGGFTNDSGVAELKTHRKYSGAPVGNYKIIVSKVEREIIGPAKTSMYDVEEGINYHLVDPIYSTTKETPLEVEIVKGKNVKSFELGKQVKAKVKGPGDEKSSW